MHHIRVTLSLHPSAARLWRRGRTTGAADRTSLAFADPEAAGIEAQSVAMNRVTGFQPLEHLQPLPMPLGSFASPGAWVSTGSR